MAYSLKPMRMDYAVAVYGFVPQERVGATTAWLGLDCSATAACVRTLPYPRPLTVLLLLLLPLLFVSGS